MDTPTAAATETGFSFFSVFPTVPASFFALAELAEPEPVVPTDPVSTVVVSFVFAPAAASTLEDKLVSLLVSVPPLFFAVSDSFSSNLLFAFPVSEVLPDEAAPEVVPVFLPVLLFPVPNAFPDKISAMVELYLSLYL